jgi:hypothetical protein
MFLLFGLQDAETLAAQAGDAHEAGEGVLHSMMRASVPTPTKRSLWPGRRTSEPSVSATTPKLLPSAMHLPIMSR